MLDPVTSNLTPYWCPICLNPQDPSSSEQVFAQGRWFSSVTCFRIWLLIFEHYL